MELLEKMKIKIYSYSLFFMGIIFFAIGAFYFWSYFNNEALIKAGHEPNYLIPNPSGKSGIWVLLFSIVLIKTWFGPLAVIVLGSYIIYNSFLSKNANP